MVDIHLQKQLTGKSGGFVLNIKLQIEKNKIIGIYGDSGEGKTTLAKMISGIVKPDRGEITVAGTVWYNSKKKIYLKPQRRAVNLMFQDYALFPNMSVRENLKYALKRSESSLLIEDIIEIIALKNLENSKINELSGGQQQRVALARAIINLPQLLILDEPLSAIDNEMRQKLQEYILKIHKTYQLTTIIISHNVNKLYQIADLVYVLKNGELQLKAFDNNTKEALKNISGVVLNKCAKSSFVEIVISYDNTELSFTLLPEQAKNIKEGQVIEIPPEIFRTQYT